MISVFDRIENIVGEGENAGYQHFLLLPWLCKSFLLLVSDGQSPLYGHMIDITGPKFCSIPTLNNLETDSF